MVDQYYGITHYVRFNCLMWLWGKTLCKLNWHLFDEVWSSHNHSLDCDACGLSVEIKDIKAEKLWISRQ